MTELETARLAVVRAAMRESRNDLAREGPLEWTGTEAQRMKVAARFRNTATARRMRACAKLLLLQEKL